jgi:hypothetical protein
MTQRVAVVGRGRASQAGRLLAVNFAACLLLLIQYLLGMAVNLYVTLPGRHPGAGSAMHATFAPVQPLGRAHRRAGISP